MRKYDLKVRLFIMMIFFVVFLNLATTLFIMDILPFGSIYSHYQEGYIKSVPKQLKVAWMLFDLQGDKLIVYEFKKIFVHLAVIFLLLLGIRWLIEKEKVNMPYTLILLFVGSIYLLGETLLLFIFISPIKDFLLIGALKTL